MLHPITTKLLMLVGGGLRFIKLILSSLAGFILIFTITFLGVYFYFARDLPDIRTLEDYKPPLISEVFASDGTKIGEFWSECRIFTPFGNIPKLVVEAFLDAEDARFFEHKGVDIRSIARAFIANLRAGEITQGGSTITQQITRSILLSRERSFARKIKEAILATRLERYLDKEQILTLYLNQIYLGNRAYGVGAAARNYFRRPLDDLSLGQVAILAGLPSAPSKFSPIKNPEEASRRQLHVLSRMVEEGHITEEQARAAAGESFAIYIAGIDKEFNNEDAAYFTEHVRRLVKESYGDEVLYSKGLRIYTTVDMKMQSAAVDAVRRGIKTMDFRQGFRGPIEHVLRDAIPARSKEIEDEIIEEQQGDELRWPPERELGPRSHIAFKEGEAYKAIVTGFNGNDTFVQIADASGIIRLINLQWARKFTTSWLGAEGASYVSDPRSVLNVGDVILARRLEDGTFALDQDPLIQGALMAMAIPSGQIRAMVGGYDFKESEFNRATQAARQPGSSFKPFVYAAALDKGYTYDTTIIDEPVVYQVGRNKFWSPKNYGGKYNGPTPFRSALVFSRNIPTVKITFDIGTHYLTAYVRKMGITTPIDKYLSMALGANAVYLTEMVQAYAVFANSGMYVPAIAITKIEDAKGNVLESLSYAGPADVGSPLLTRSKEDRKAKILSSLNEWRTKRKIAGEELSTELFKKGFEAIEQDGLILTDLELKTLYGAQIPQGHVITPQTAYLMENLLRGVVEGGTGWRVRELGKPACGKTGTTNDETDAWFIGFVPDLAAGVWIGFDELQPIGKGAAGGNTAAPIFLSFMQEATKGLEAKDFERPEGLPHGELADMTGGSALFGARPNRSSLGWYGGPDRAGQFFEEDLEYFEGNLEDASPDERRTPNELSDPYGF